jgi:catechol 2,3-dioxygenase-like lactoylglutathione lyase family enzyme
MAFSLTLSHVGVFATDPQRMVDFYVRFLGFAVSDREVRADGEIAFLTRDAREHHQFVIASGRPADLAFNPINQLSFRVDSLATLRAMYLALKSEPVETLGSITHGNALSVYFRDPEKNRVELLIDTPWYVPQPYRVPYDIMLPDAELWASIEKQVRAVPGFKTREAWMAEIEQKITQASRARAASLNSQFNEPQINTDKHG